MSLDVTLTMPELGPDVFSANITHNVRPLFRECGADVWEWEGRIAGECMDELLEALAKMIRDPTLERFDAPNGWGTREQSIPWLMHLALACSAFPRARLSVSR